MLKDDSSEGRSEATDRMGDESVPEIRRPRRREEQKLSEFGRSLTRSRSQSRTQQLGPAHKDWVAGSEYIAFPRELL